MRTQWFSDLVLESEDMLLDLIGCRKGRVIPYTASGTAAMEACVSAFVATCRKALVINGGTFGARWGELCRYHGVNHDELNVEFGRHPAMESLEKTLSSGNYDVLLMQHHETSSGYLYDLKTISAICRDNGVYLVVDAISSFLADPFPMTDLHVDIAVVSSQKGLNLPPGLSYLIIAERVLERQAAYAGTYYLNWQTNLSNLRRGQTPYSPATHLFMQTRERLRLLKRDGVNATINAVKVKAAAFRNECRSRGWSFAAERMSNCLTGVLLPFKVRPLVEHLLKKQIYVMPCRLENMIRVAHLGTSTVADHNELIEEMVKWQKTERK